jgi:hypothetical protein
MCICVYVIVHMEGFHVQCVSVYMRFYMEGFQSLLFSFFRNRYTHTYTYVLSVCVCITVIHTHTRSLCVCSSNTHTYMLFCSLQECHSHIMRIYIMCVCIYIYMYMYVYIHGTCVCSHIMVSSVVLRSFENIWLALLGVMILSCDLCVCEYICVCIWHILWWSLWFLGASKISDWLCLVSWFSYVTYVCMTQIMVRCQSQLLDVLASDLCVCVYDVDYGEVCGS